MTRAFWELRTHLARLESDRLDAILDLTRPDKGLFDVDPGKDGSHDARLLAVRFPAIPEGQEVAPTECHARHTDLSASYPPSTTWPVRVDALWRIPTPMAIELVVSVQTDQLASRPELIVRSRLIADEVLRLIDADSAVYDTLDPGQSNPIDLRPDAGPGCLLFRLQGRNLTYAEMIHPADFLSDRLDRDPEDDRFVRIGHHLFQEPLEKGVIRRARIQGVFLPRNDDTRLAAACYSAFAASEPPIAT